MRAKLLPVNYITATIASIMLCAGCSSKTIIHTPVSGPWLITLSTPDVGEINTIMQFDVNGKDSAGNYLFTASTARNMDRKIIGFWKSEMARLFTNDFKNGSLVRIKKGTINDKDSLSGILVTPFGNFYIRTRITNDSMAGVLENGNHATIGIVTGTHNVPARPLRNYKMLTEDVLKTAQDKIYDPAMLKTAAWQKFSERMRRISAVTNDDATYVMAFFYYARSLPFSHFNLYRPLTDTNSKQLNSTSHFVLLTEKQPGTIYMQVKSFAGSSQEMDSAFQYIKGRQCRNLIVDLRDNSGGSIEAGMAFARHLFTDTTYGGIFLTQKYFDHETVPPPSRDYSKYPSFSAANYDLFIKGINKQEGVTLKVIPDTPVYTGKIYVLINGNTASTCEPIVYALKEYKRAILVGQKTAGAMMTGEHFDICDGFELTIPTAVYYTADAHKIDKTGVMPDHETPPADALNEALKEINAQ